MIYLLVFSVIYSLMRANFNCLIINKENWHAAQGLFVATAVVGFLLMYYIEPVNLDFFKQHFHVSDQGWVQDSFIIGILSFYFFTIHWIVFDISLNLMRHLKWDYFNPDGESEIDRFLQENQFKVKGFFLILCGLLIIYYYQNNFFETIGYWFSDTWNNGGDWLTSIF